MMEKYFKIFAGMVATALITAGCESLTYAQTDTSSGYYNQQPLPPGNGYNYNTVPNNGYGYDSDNGYGDGQPGDNEVYDQAGQPMPPPDPNSMAYSQQPDVAAGQPPVGFNDFYNQLTPYGNWVNMPPYNQVWIPNVSNFQPYSSNGYWAYTTYGWTWVSNYQWGWAPFHYGRWGYSNMYGWYWVPGYVWGPAWVAWSSSADMYGWAPLMPGMHFGVSLSLNLFPSSYWTFMPGRYMGSTNIRNYFVNRSRNVNIIRNTTLINNFGTENNRRYTMGPRATDVQKYTGRSIKPMRVTNASNNRSTGISNNELRVYRPVTRSASTNRRTTTPAANNRAAAPQARTQAPAQPENRAVAPANNNRAVAPQARAQAPAQPENRAVAPANNNNRAAAPQARAQAPAQPERENRAVAPQAKPQQAAQRTYQPRPEQPAVTNTAAPQSSRQIHAAQGARQRTQPARPATRTNAKPEPRR